MDCSRCGGELETYSLGEKEACVCLDCGFVDTPVEHEATKRPEPEPWTKALERFHERYAEGDVAVVGSGETAALLKMDDDPETADSPSDSESDQRGDDADTTDSEAGDADSENETTDEGDGESVTEDGTDEDVDGETASDEDVDGETASDTVEEREKPA